jgi:hypothetical protein
MPPLSETWPYWLALVLLPFALPIYGRLVLAWFCFVMGVKK